MRSILYVVTSLDVGGTERHLAQITSALDRRRWQPAIAVLRPGGALVPTLRARGIEILEPPIPGWVAALPPIVSRGLQLVLAGLWLLRMLKRRRPDVVHFFLPEAYLVGGLCALAAGCRHRVMSRRSLNVYHGRHRLAARLERFLHRRMGAVLGNSAAVVEELKREGVSPGRLHLIYNGIDPAPFAHLPGKPEARQNLRLPSSGFVMAVVANLIPYKGHADLLAALDLIARELPQPWTLICVGRDDGIGAELHAEAARRGFGNHILWLGSRTDVPGILAAADIGILCSHEEGFPNAVLEGMAAGLPMIVTDVGGSSEAVLDGVTGLVVPPRDPRRLGQAILALARSPARAAEMGTAGQARVKACFSLEKCMRLYLELYTKLANRA